MKKIKFGYATEDNPHGAWEGIGIKPGLLLNSAEYYGVVKYENNSYVIAKVIEDEYGRYPELVGNFIVRGAIADLYPDGSGTLFLDQEHTEVSSHLESHLNNPEVKKRINDINDVVNSCNDVVYGDRSFILLSLFEEVLATSISHEVFEMKNDAIKNCHQSFSELAISKSNGLSR